MPPNVLGMIDDFWCRFVADVGNAGPDKGKGGKYLLLPPGYTGAVPEGYFVLRSRTYGNLMFFRGFIVNGDLRPAVENAKKNFRVYPLARAANPPAMNFVNISGQSFNTIHANDASFFEEVAHVVQEEPLDAIDPETRGLLAAIGIQKGKPFAPDARMKGILADAAAVGNATARALVFSTRDRDAYFYPNSAWKTCWIGNDYEFSPGGVLDPDARTLFFYLASESARRWTVKMVGIGSQYAIAERDAAGQYLDGAKTYRLHLPPNIPAKDFWSLLVYDPQTRSMLQTDQQFPSIEQPEGGHRHQPGHISGCLLRPEAARRQGSQLDTDHPRQGVVGRCCGSTARSSPGSTRPGGPGRLSWFIKTAPIPACENPLRLALAYDGGGLSRR